MFSAVGMGIILLDGWGMIGIWTQNFGFHHVWEVWVGHNGALILKAEPLADRLLAGLPNILWPLRLPLVLVLSNHDIRSHAPWKRIFILQPLLHHRQGVFLYRTPRL